jgi:Tfp pilus assembly protein PilF
VNDSKPARSPRSVLFPCAAFVIAATLLIGIAWAIRTSPRRIGVSSAKTFGSAARSRDAYADSPFQNARPGVAYVGDAACARCHHEIAAEYHSHPMGRSLALIASDWEGPPVTAAAGLPFEAKGWQYNIERRDRHIVHKATRRSAEGSVLAEIEAEVRFALGSGTRGTTFLIERDGFLFQSPISWFAQKGRWDISPGYGELNARPNFERIIEPECLFCHVNQVRPVAGTLNRYEPQIFEGHAIGCERCHGPGALHVNRSGESTEFDLTIVNPAKLAPALRDSVCQQCHLQGWFRFSRGGHEFSDFRPGLPMHRFMAVFVRTNDKASKLELAGQVEQMESSRCFRASQRQLGCISCHDPHRLPAPAGKAAYFRRRCLECHEKKGCALQLAERQFRGPGEDCIACHMPRSAVTNIPHMAETDHRIPRGVPSPVPRGPHDAPGLPGELMPRNFHRELMTDEERRDAARDLGVALESVARILYSSPAMARVAATQALPLLEEAVRDRPDDLTASESLGYALGVLNRRQDALRVYEEILRVEPARESTLHSYARVLNQDQRPDLARLALQKTIAVNPWRSNYRLALANACYKAGDWPGSIAACGEALRLNPDLFEARSLLVQSHLRSGALDKADAEFQIMLRFYPASREIWERWYEQQKQPERGGANFAATGEP